MVSLCVSSLMAGGTGLGLGALGVSTGAMIFRSTALGPFVSGIALNETRWPAFKLVKPASVSEVVGTNTSLVFSSGVIKPKPFTALKNLTVPVCIFFLI